jgi:ABC-type molybdenum transport system ATPase subunit/photorepair protein PhrA
VDRCSALLCMSFLIEPTGRLAITILRSRTFMRSVVSHRGPGLLLFDEPSASLDPTAEHGMYLYTLPII